METWALALGVVLALLVAYFAARSRKIPPLSLPAGGAPINYQKSLEAPLLEAQAAAQAYLAEALIANGMTQNIAALDLKAVESDAASKHVAPPGGVSTARAGAAQRAIMNGGVNLLLSAQTYSSLVAPWKAETVPLQQAIGVGEASTRTADDADGFISSFASNASTLTSYASSWLSAYKIAGEKPSTAAANVLSRLSVLSAGQMADLDSGAARLRASGQGLYRAALTPSSN